MANNDLPPQVTVVVNNSSGCRTLLKLLFVLVLLGAFLIFVFVDGIHKEVAEEMAAEEMAAEEMTAEEMTAEERVAEERAAEERAAEEKAEKRVESEWQAAPDPEQIPDVIEKPLDLAAIQYPATIVTTEKLELLNKEGKETPIPVGTIINIKSRSDNGTLQMAVSGELFVGNEYRLMGKIELK